VAGPYAPGVSIAADRISDTLAVITASLVSRHDAGSVLRVISDACATLLDADAVGAIAADPRGGLQVIAASDQPARLIELLQTQLHQGPCVDSIAANAVITTGDLAEQSSRWPDFAPAATAAGFRSCNAFPMRLEARAFGGLNVLRSSPEALTEVQLGLGQCLADLAVLGLSQERDERRAERLAEQTLATLNDRVRISHAVGMLAAALTVEPAAARALLSAYGASTGRTLRDLAHALAEGGLTADTVRDVVERSRSAQD
jgi:hypothetical protein